MGLAVAGGAAVRRSFGVGFAAGSGSLGSSPAATGAEVSGGSAAASGSAGSSTVGGEGVTGAWGAGASAAGSPRRTNTVVAPARSRPNASAPTTSQRRDARVCTPGCEGTGPGPAMSGIEGLAAEYTDDAVTPEISVTPLVVLGGGG